ncbi:MAG: hypothetical protein ACAI44_18335, partial [Candidatus Sericytochromatia bacterium]
IVNRPRGWKSAVFFMLISCSALYLAMFKVNDFLFELIYRDFKNYYNIIAFAFPFGFIIESALINLFLLRFSFEKVLSSYVKTKLILSVNQFELHEQIFGFERIQTVPVSELRDIYRHDLPGRRYGNLVLYRAGGKRTTVGYQLNQTDTYAYLSELSASLKAAAPVLHPVFAEVMANWTRRCESWNTLYTGEPAPASTDQSRIWSQERDGRLQIKILPHDMSGLLTLLFGAGMGMTLVGLSLLTKVDMFNLHLIPFFYAFACSDEIWCNYATQSLQHLVLGLGLSVYGMGLMMRSVLSSSVSSTLEMDAEELEITHEFMKWHWRKKMNLSELKLSSRLDPGSLARQMVIKGKGRRRTAAYCLNPAEVQDLSGRIEAWRQEQELPAELPPRPIVQSMGSVRDRFMVRLREVVRKDAPEVHEVFAFSEIQDPAQSREESQYDS